QIASHQNTNAKFGVEMMIKNVLALRLGFSAKPVEIFAGLGYTHRNLLLEVAFERHESLGYSPQISLTYRFDTKKSKD
ncbi:MAG: hypothetical protein ACRCZB_06520, partial [Bacteroidales bacterium]